MYKCFIPRILKIVLIVFMCNHANAFAQLKSSITINTPAIKVEYADSIKKEAQAAYYLNGVLLKSTLLTGLVPENIDKLDVKKGVVEIEDVRYNGQIYISTKKEFPINYISLSDLKSRYINLKHNACIFFIDNVVVNDVDYDKILVNENFVLKIVVGKIKNEKQKVNFTTINLISKTEENIKKSKEIMIRGDALSFR